MDIFKKIFPGCLSVASAQHMLISNMDNGTEIMLIKPASVRGGGGGGCKNLVFKERIIRKYDSTRKSDSSLLKR